MKRQESSYPLQPPRERGTGRAIALAVVMHLLLGYFLYHGIQWQNSTPAGAEAELWTEVPDTVLPRPVVTPPIKVAPPPVDNTEADIALQEKKRQQQEAARQAQLAEQQRQKQQADQEAQAQRQQQLAAQAAQLAAQKAADAKQKQQQQQADKLRQQQLAEQQKQDQLKQAQADAKKKADADKLAKARTDAQQTKKLDQERRARLAQMQGLAGGGDASSGDGLAKSGTGSGSGGTAASAGYAEKVQRRVRPNIVWAGDTQGLETVIAVRCAPTGTLLSATITRSSGNEQWDQAAQRAVQRSDPMPLDTNGKTPASFTITLRPAA